MFSSMSSDESFHPFSHYKKGKVESYGDSHYLRIYPNVLWVMDDKEPNKGKRRVYNQHGLKEYEMESHEITEFKLQLESSKVLQKQREEKLKKIQAQLTGTTPIDFKSAEAITVLQHEYAVTKSTSQQPILGSFGAGPCVILALYDNKNKTAVLAHIDATTDIDSLVRIFSHLSKEDTVAHLIGGDISTQDMCLDIVELLEKQNIKIVNTEIVRSSFDSPRAGIRY